MGESQGHLSSCPCLLQLSVTEGGSWPTEARDDVVKKWEEVFLVLFFLRLSIPY